MHHCSCDGEQIGGGKLMSSWVTRFGLGPNQLVPTTSIASIRHYLFVVFFFFCLITNYYSVYISIILKPLHQGDYLGSAWGTASCGCCSLVPNALCWLHAVNHALVTCSGVESWLTFVKCSQEGNIWQERNNFVADLIHITFRSSVPNLNNVIVPTINVN